MLFQLLRIGFLKGDPSVMFFLPFFAFLLSVSLWPLIKLKRVSVDNDFLYVSNYFNETRISIRDIYNVTENRWINFHPVTIHLRSPSEFGRKIVFAPHVPNVWIFHSSSDRR